MNKKCPVFNVTSFIGKKWTLLILLELYKGKLKWKRYSQLKEKLPGITPKILSMRLKELRSRNMLKHKVSAKTFPIKSQYALTPRGEDFVKVIKGVKRWGLKWGLKNEHCENMNCSECEL